ncbi:nitric oxide reductase activation protein-like protein [Caballeronia choica]|uniref:Nitric oxide reductase activation protein-like protein n=2 Tax=Caballeronia choica TaxID=326476 RepID=A0A158K3P5_9BURK|nr:nitric oxide reductase activation protein-like protein [Caballeronia choica]
MLWTGSSMLSSDLDRCVVPGAIGRNRTTFRHLRLYAHGFGQHGVDVGRNDLASAPDDDQAMNLSRTSITGNAIILPSNVHASDSRLIGNAIVAHAVGHLRFSEPGRPVGTRVPMMVAMLSLMEDVRIERLMIRECPGLRELWRRFHRAGGQLQAMGLTFGVLAERLSLALHDPGYRDTHHWVEKGRSMIEAIGTRLEDTGRFREVASILANDLGQMRVPFDPQCYQVEPQYRDDNTYLWRFENEEIVTAVVQAQGARVQRVEDAAGGRQDESEETESAPESIRLMYPEWNYKARVLRDDWVSVVEGAHLQMSALDSDSPNGARSARSAWIEYPEVLSFHRLRHQADGDEIDLEALVTHVVTQRSGKVPDGRVFTRTGRRARDASILLLLDLSASTSRSVDASGRTLLDCEREAAHEVTSVFDSGHVRIALHGFSSNRRSEVRYVRFKDFGERLEARHWRRLEAVRPAWSTRIGPALRHAGTCLEQESSVSKTIMLVTDGEPSDIDIFDPRYLVEDARHAVHGLAVRGVRVQCISVDPVPHREMCEIFGWRNTFSLTQSTRLFDILPNLLSRLVA